MSVLDLTSLEPNKISRDLKGKFILIFGPPKIGKTSLSSLFPKPLLFCFERGVAALPNVKAVNIDRWSDFKQYCSQLKKPEVKEQFETLVIDTAGIATDLCEKFILNQNNVEKLSDLSWGDGWTQYKKEFETTFRELTYLGYGIVFIGHSVQKATTFKDAEGEPIQAEYPDIAKTGMKVINRLVDVIAYLGAEYDISGKSERYLYLRATPYIFAGSRYRFLPEKIPFGYDSLVNAIADSIETEVKMGASTTDKTDMTPSLQREYSEAIAEARELWLKLTANDNEEMVRKILKIVSKYLGKEMKLSEIPAQQQDILEVIISEMKEL